jgi:hypothetical protein
MKERWSDCDRESAVLSLTESGLRSFGLCDFQVIQIYTKSLTAGAYRTHDP